MEDSVYFRMRHRIEAKPDSVIKLDDIAQVIAPEKYLYSLRSIPIYQITKSDNSSVVIDIMQIIEKIKKKYEKIDVQSVGPSSTIVEILYKKKKVSILFFVLIWLILFIGSALAIMNFHEDVSMQGVHQKIYKMITGRDVRKPLVLQIPYSFGLGLGMILFFNHIFRKRFNEEPTPLEVEIFKYQQDLDQYVVINENKESIRRLDDK